MSDNAFNHEIYELFYIEDHDEHEHKNGIVTY